MKDARKGPELRLNIKSDKAHQMTQELAKLAGEAGESIMATVTEAVREGLERVRREHAKGLADCLMTIGKDCASRLSEPLRSADHGDLL